ncbi:MAG: leucine-rich repeat protein [Clostridia bacterium]|nr:leucine-rich repeat protein [Clostridia bacterium]
MGSHSFKPEFAFKIIAVMIALAMTVITFASCIVFDPSEPADTSEPTAEIPAEETAGSDETSDATPLETPEPEIETEPPVTREPEETGPQPTEHIHSYPDEYKFDENDHWKECECGQKADITSHTAGEWTVGAAEGNSGEYVVQRLCKVCGNPLSSINIGKLSGKPSQGLSYRYIRSTDSYAVIGSGECTDTVINIPPVYEGKLVTEVGADSETVDDWDKIFLSYYDENPFRFNANITEIVIPGTVKEIHAFAFSQGKGNPSSLRKVVIPEGVESISLQAFSYTEVHDLELPSTLKKIEPLMSRVFSQNHGAFPGYDPIVYYVDTYGPTYSELGGFYYDDNLTNISISPYNTYLVYDSGCFIEKGTGKLVTRLNGTTIPDYVTEICDSTFCFLDIKDLVIPDSVKKIGNFAFYGSKIETLTCGSGLVSIGKEAFRDCKNLNTVNLPAGLSEIGKEAFYVDKNIEFNIAAGNTQFVFENNCLINKPSCRLLKANDGASVPGYVKSIDPYACIGVDFAYIDCSGFTGIGEFAFSKCTGLGDVVISNAISIIPEGLFEDSSMTSITFGSELETISDSAFYGCTVGGDIVLPQGFTTLGQNVFYSCSAKTLTLPATCSSVGYSSLDFKKIDEVRFAGTTDAFGRLVTLEFGFAVDYNTRVVCSDGLFDLNSVESEIYY